MRLKPLGICAALAVALASPHTAGAQPYQVRDIFTNGSGGTPFVLPVPFGPGLVFWGGDNANGGEPWFTDGTFAGTRMLLDISPGLFGNNLLKRGVAGGGYVYFIAQAPGYDDEVWRTDGTSPGTQRVTDFPGQSGPVSLAFAGGILFIVVTDPATGTELWKADATPTGASLVRDIVPGADSSFPEQLTAAGNQLFFAARTSFSSTFGDLWRSDGTAAGTIRLGDDVAGPREVRALAAVGSGVYFSGRDGDHGDEIWKSDGSQPGTVRVADVAPGPVGSSPRDLAVAGTTVFFAARTPDSGEELWKTDGSAPGTVLVVDLVPGPDDSEPRDVTAVGSRVFFHTFLTPPSPLWVSDGTAAGTLPLGSQFSFPTELTAHGSLLYFVATDTASGEEVWRSDGTAAGTYRVTDIDPGPLSANPRNLQPALGQIFFSADDASGYGIWRTDGTAAGTQRVRTDGPWNYSSYPSPVGPAGQSLLFAVGLISGPIWLSDGTAPGTAPVAPAFGPTISPETVGTAVGGRLFLAAFDSTHGSEPWMSDGTPAGTRLATDVNPGPAGFGPYPLTAVGNRVFMSGTVDDYYLGVMPGNVPNPTVALISTSPGSSPVSFKDQLFYLRQAASGDSELWRSDGTSAGTRVVTTLDPTSHLMAGRTTLYMFAGHAQTTGRELWASDGTAAGTRFVRDICPGTCSSLQGIHAEETAVIGDTLFFVAEDGVHGLELWKSDGTTAGTVLVRDVRPGSASSDPSVPTELDGLLYFLANDGASGVELWRSDGTEAGTHRVTDIQPGPGWSFGEYPRELYSAAGHLYFAAHTYANGLELWRSDGTAAGTSMVADIAPGVSSSAPFRFARAGRRLYFSAHDGATGFELWALDLGPTASIGDVVVVEPDSGTTTATFEVHVDGAVSAPATVSYGVVDGTATASSDFLPVSGVLTFVPGGPATLAVSVPVLGDQVQEMDESFEVRLANEVGVSIDRRRGDGVILDEDPTRVTVADAAIGEGNTGSATMAFTATLTTEDRGASTLPTTIGFETHDHIATAGHDYDEAAGTVTFPPGSPSGATRTVDVVVRGDVVDEGDESFALEVRPLSSSSVEGDARGTIRDDDGSSSGPTQGVQHGRVVWADLAPLPGGTADTDWYFMGSGAYASYEVVADATSGSIGPLQIDRLASDDVTILDQGTAVGTGSARTMRWINGPTGLADRIRVRSGDCGTSCTPADVYRLRVYETTYSIPRFHGTGGLTSFVILQNRTTRPVQAQIHFWLQFVAGAPVTVAVSLPPRGTQIVPSPQSVGSATVVHDGGYGALAGKAVTVDPAVGTSYDTVMEPRRR